jgi:hypothetical protein
MTRWIALVHPDSLARNPSMTEQSPSAGALHVAETFIDTRERWHKLARRIDSLCEQRVSAETERWQNRDRQRLEQISALQAAVQSFQSARDERSAPEGPQSDVWTEEDIRAAQAKADELVKAFERLDALASTGEQPDEWVLVPRSPTTEMLKAAYDDARANGNPLNALDCWDSMIETAPAPLPPLWWTTPSEALTVARDAIEGVPSHLLPYRINSEEIAQTIAPDIAAALSAVASERDAAAIRAFGQRVWSDTEEVAYQAGVSDTRARLQEPDVREAVRVAIASVSDYGNAYVQNLNRADAALTRIAEMLK